MTGSQGPTPHEWVEIIGAVIMNLGVVMFLVALLYRWMAPRGYILGNVAYPMGKKALDPQLNREARRRDLEVGRRFARRLWSLWPLLRSDVRGRPRSHHCGCGHGMSPLVGDDPTPPGHERRLV